MDTACRQLWKCVSLFTLNESRHLIYNTPQRSIRSAWQTKKTAKNGTILQAIKRMRKIRILTFFRTSFRKVFQKISWNNLINSLGLLYLISWTQVIYETRCRTKRILLRPISFDVIFQKCTCQVKNWKMMIGICLLYIRF